MRVQDNSVWCDFCKKLHDIDTEVLVLHEVDVVCEANYPTRYLVLCHTWDVPKWIVKNPNEK